MSGGAYRVCTKDDTAEKVIRMRDSGWGENWTTVLGVISTPLHYHFLLLLTDAAGAIRVKSRDSPAEQGAK